ncbi:hypothetical protein B0H34DRAFT_655595 [Crassisporium funariophilum]|nr:hypothetical protein B0H34DRAFT_655595 [Crassisporium funariophilum]
MDPSRTPHSPALGKRRRTTPSNDYMVPLGHQSQTSLPSIRQLHPYLPPSGMPAQHMSSDSSGYGYPGPSSQHYAPHLGQPQDTGSSHVMGASQRETGMYGAVDSEADDLDQTNPPKKKRRRQALSCTGDCIHPFVIRVH